MTPKEHSEELINKFSSLSQWVGGEGNISLGTEIGKRCAIICVEYAKQQAIAFDEWKWANRWHSLENGFWYQTLEHPSAMSDKTYNKHHRKTPQELYNQFIEQQNKDNDR